MKFYVGKTLELVGMSLLAFGLVEGMTNPEHGMRNEYLMLAMGSAVFYIGWLVERMGGEGGGGE
jgi:hypothetical protein